MRTADGDRIHRRLAAPDEIGGLCDRLDAQWHRQRLADEFVARHATRLLATTRDLLTRLYDLLVGPLVGALPLDAGRLLVVPDGVVHRVPFAALAGADGDLADRVAITTTPGLGVAARLGLRSRTSAPASVLVLGVSDDDTPSVRDEVVAVAAAYRHARSRVDAEATKAALAAGAPEADVVHLACHGLFRATNPMFSAVQLGDGWVTADDLAAMPLAGTLVVLSACESGRQAGRGRGDESTGLTWALLAAGAIGVVVSQWLVDDRAGAELMTDLHHRLAAGQAPDLALRDAQLACRANRPDPYFWAPFTYVGGVWDSMNPQP